MVNAHSPLSKARLGSRTAMLFIATTLLSCVAQEPDKADYLRVVVGTNLSVPTDIDRFSIVVERSGVPLRTFNYDKTVLERIAQTPDSLVIDNPNPSNDSPDKLAYTLEPIRISVVGYAVDTVRVSRTAKLQFNAGRYQLPLPLCRSCLDKTSCLAGQTCKGGTCEDESLKASALPTDEAAQLNPLVECGSP